MNYSDTALAIRKAINSDPYNTSLYEDMFQLVRVWYDESHEQGKKGNLWLRDKSLEIIASNKTSKGDYFRDLYDRTLLFASPWDFDSYLLYVEHNKPYDSQFYRPRRHFLKQVVDAYQRLNDRVTEVLIVNLPKRAGKSQLGINFCCWRAGIYPTRSILMEGTGDDLVKSFYNGCLEYLTVPSDYSYSDIFPYAKVVQTSADTKIINLAERNRFPSIMCRSIDARQVGLSEATNLLYLDDCVEGYREAQNRDALEEKWRVISGDVIGRKLSAPIVMCGTCYSLYDPIQKLIDTSKDRGWNYEIMKIPAVDPITDESNFEYEKDGEKIFTTKYFHDQRAMLTPQQWAAEFLQEPFEAKGLVFPPDELNYYVNLPEDVEPDTIVAACDTSEGKGDATCLVIGAVYGKDVYIIDVVFDTSPPIITQRECANALVKNKVANCTFESNLSGSAYGKDVGQLIEKMGASCGIRTKRSVANKQIRIEESSPNILNNFWFKDKSLYKPNSQYGEFLKEVTTHTRVGKHTHDDAPDALSQLETILRTETVSKVILGQRFF